MDLCVFGRYAKAQAAQKHQEQRQQSRPRRLLPVAEEAASPARPSGRAPVAAHALGAQPGPEHCTPGPRTRLGNLRRSLAPGPAGAPRTSGSRSPLEPPRSPRQIPKPEEKRAGQVRELGISGREGGRPELPPAGSRSLGAQSLGPGSRERAQLRSLCLAQRSGRPVPRRPLRAQLPLSMPGAGRCPERVPPARGFCSPPRPTGPGSPGSPGRRRREPTRKRERANQPASQGAGARRPRRVQRGSGRSQPSSPRAAAAALLKGQRAPSARTRAGTGGGAPARGFSRAGAGGRGPAGGRPVYSSQTAGNLSSPPRVTLNPASEGQGCPPTRPPAEGGSREGVVSLPGRNEDSSLGILPGRILGGRHEKVPGSAQCHSSIRNPEDN
ncbi:PREDICTED: translation initiation factor IF-2-like [Rhinopithecus bieti]|uniref:translation initiation factor IF-2-like n=1 Tax=Rhinopithecus bieti TaxID=61621 RepID=UPI00083BD785|nr:PREDICTED: translation initiation factor IF-2-like [Rhinopithecus bieti]